MARITRIGVGGFRSIKDLQPLDLKPVNLLIGSNGAGKSNLISFLRMLRAIGESSLQLFVGRSGGAETLLYYGSKQTPAMWFTVDFEGKAGSGNYWCWLGATVTDSLIFQQEQVTYARVKAQPPRTTQLGSGHKESLLLEGENDYRETWDLLSDTQIFHFHDTSESGRIRKHGYVENDRFLEEDGANLAAFLHGLKRRQLPYYRRIVEAIRRIAPFFDDFDLVPKAENGNQSVLLNWRDRDSTHLFGPHQLSDGTLRAMAIVTLLLQPETQLPPVIVLDEPEIGLHPHAIEVLAALIRSASTHSTMIVATQSAALVNHFAPEEVIVVSRTEAASRFERQSGESLAEWLKDYTIGELWERNVIGGTPVS